MPDSWAHPPSRASSPILVTDDLEWVVACRAGEIQGEGTTRHVTDTGTSLRALFELSGRSAIVTGASSGLGERLARALAEAGARVAVTARRADRLERLASDIGGAALPADLLDLESIPDLVARAADLVGSPEILINAAGDRVSDRPAEDEALEAVRKTIDLNLVAPFRLAQAVYPYMEAMNRGSIVNISSISGHVGVGGIPQASYAASKMGLSGLTAELAIQWAPRSIRVNTVAPGFFRSEITEPLYESERGRSWLRRNTPLPYEATTNDLVGMVLCLASDAGRFITGQTIVVDGGWVAR